MRLFNLVLCVLLCCEDVLSTYRPGKPKISTKTAPTWKAAEAQIQRDWYKEEHPRLGDEWWYAEDRMQNWDWRKAERALREKLQTLKTQYTRDSINAFVGLKLKAEGVAPTGAEDVAAGVARAEDLGELPPGTTLLWSNGNANTKQINYSPTDTREQAQHLKAAIIASRAVINDVMERHNEGLIQKRMIISDIARKYKKLRSTAEQNRDVKIQSIARRGKRAVSRRAAERTQTMIDGVKASFTKTMQRLKVMETNERQMIQPVPSAVLGLVMFIKGAEATQDTDTWPVEYKFIPIEQSTHDYYYLIQRPTQEPDETGAEPRPRPRLKPSTVQKANDAARESALTKRGPVATAASATRSRSAPGSGSTSRSRPARGSRPGVRRRPPRQFAVEEPYVEELKYPMHVNPYENFNYADDDMNVSAIVMVVAIYVLFLYCLCVCCSVIGVPAGCYLAEKVNVDVRMCEV